MTGGNLFWKQKNCSVYFHKAPNNKVYIGQTSKNPVELWSNRILKEALDGVKKIPEFEKQLLEFIASQEDQTKRLVKIEEDSKRRERNKLRDRLLQSYRYYTSLEYNPRKEWTRMESEAFGELFSDYEEADGNGYVHTEIQPAMNLLTIIEISDVNRISLLMQSRK